jgi:hypothetical protein
MEQISWPGAFVLVGTVWGGVVMVLGAIYLSNKRNNLDETIDAPKDYLTYKTTETTKKEKSE